MAEKPLPADFLEFLANRTPLDYDRVPEEIREWFRIEVEQGGKRGLYEESSFWHSKINTVRNDEGYEVEQCGPATLILRTPEGEDLTLNPDYWIDGTDNVVGLRFPRGLTWDESDQVLGPEELRLVMTILDDAYLAFETHTKFWVDRSFSAFDA